MNFIRLLLLLLVLTAAIAGENSNRILLKPPDNAPTTRISDKEYVKGEIYLSKSADPSLLKPFGFRNVSFYASASQYNRYRAMWPKATVLDSLPPEVVGINYECGPSSDGHVFVSASKARPQVYNTGTGVFVRGPTGGQYRKFTDACPAVPDTHLYGLPYAKGYVFLSSLPDSITFRKLGFTPLHEVKSSWSGDPSIEEYLSNPERYDRQLDQTHVYQYRACYPMDLNPNKLPANVINLISEQSLTAGSAGGKPQPVIFEVR